MGPYFGGSAIAAIVNFPLWKAAAIGQSGFTVAANSMVGRLKLILGPPYKGVAATIFGMTWARAAIFYFSDTGKETLQQLGASTAVATTLPPVAVSALVQVANQPIVRGTIMLQDPASKQPNVISQLAVLYRAKGASVSTCPRTHLSRRAVVRPFANPAHPNSSPPPLCPAQALWHGTSASVLKTVPK